MIYWKLWLFININLMCVVIDIQYIFKIFLKIDDVRHSYHGFFTKRPLVPGWVCYLGCQKGTVLSRISHPKLSDFGCRSKYWFHTRKKLSLNSRKAGLSRRLCNWIRIYLWHILVWLLMAEYWPIRQGSRLKAIDSTMMMILQSNISLNSSQKLNRNILKKEVWDHLVFRV